MRKLFQLFVAVLFIFTFAASVSAQTNGKTDKEIDQRLSLIFSFVEELKDVSVSVRSGVVQLKGHVASTEAVEEAERLASEIEGVAYVDNDIELVKGWEQLINPSVRRIRERLTAIAARLPLILLALLVVGVAISIAQVLRKWQGPFRLIAKNKLVRGIARQVAATAVVVLGVLAALELLEATKMVGALLGAAGLLGVALGFAFRDIAENYLASILLGIRRPFAANDHVVINKEYEGKVVRLTTRETVLMTLEGNHLRLPNSLVYKAVILNYTRNPLRLFKFAAGFSTDADLVQAQHVALDALAKTPGVVADPKPFSRVEELGDWNVIVHLFAWVDQRVSDWFKVRSEGIRRVKDALDAAAIAMPVPIHQVNLTDALSPAAKQSAPTAVSGNASSDSRQAHEIEPDFVLEEQIEDEKEKAKYEETDLLEASN